MDTNVNYTMVGLFVISLIAAIVLGIIWLSAGLSLEGNATYLVYMQESVSGLSVDSPIEYNGVTVGTVKSIQLNKQNPHLVEVFLNIKSDTPITVETVATLNTRGLTGITYMALKDKGTDATPLRAGAGQPYPVIPTAPSFFLRIDTMLNKLTGSLTQLSKSLQSVLDQENQRSIKAILFNLDRATRTSNGVIQSLETQTIPAANQAIANLNDLAKNLSGVSSEIKQNPAILIRGKEQQPLGPGEK